MRLIDADALIGEMHNIILEDGEDRRVFYAVIERQPTVEEPQWIPCSDCERRCKKWEHSKTLQE